MLTMAGVVKLTTVLTGVLPVRGPTEPSPQGPAGGEGQLRLVPSRPVPLSTSYRLNRGIPLLRNVPTHLSYIVHSWTWTKVFTVGLTMSLDN